jgi:hypothetical protein
MSTPYLSRVRALPARRVARLAILARPLLRQAARVTAWTVVWTLFQWWAVIGWPDGVDAFSGGLACTGVLSLAMAGVLLDVRGGRRPAPAIIMALRRPRDADVVEPPAVRDLAA